MENELTIYEQWQIEKYGNTLPDFGGEFEVGSEEMQRAAEWAAKQAEQELLITQQNAQKKVKEAEADKEATKLQAEAKALEGEGIKKYNESVATNWDIELKKLQLQIELKKVERWDGKYISQNSYGPIPFSTGDILGK